MFSWKRFGGFFYGAYIKVLVNICAHVGKYVKVSGWFYILQCAIITNVDYGIGFSHIDIDWNFFCIRRHLQGLLVV